MENDKYSYVDELLDDYQKIVGFKHDYDCIPITSQELEAFERKYIVIHKILTIKIKRLHP